MVETRKFAGFSLFYAIESSSVTQIKDLEHRCMGVIYQIKDLDFTAYERNSPLDVPTYAFGQGIMRFKPHNTSFRPFCTIFNHPPDCGLTL